MDVSPSTRIAGPVCGDAAKFLFCGLQLLPLVVKALCCEGVVAREKMSVVECRKESVPIGTLSSA